MIVASPSQWTLGASLSRAKYPSLRCIELPSETGCDPDNLHGPALKFDMLTKENVRLLGIATAFLHSLHLRYRSDHIIKTDIDVTFNSKLIFYT